MSQHFINPQKRYISKDAGLTHAALELFHGRKEALLYCYQYASPFSEDDPVRGAQLWDSFVHNNKDYYLYSEEKKILEEHATAFQKYATDSYTLVDLGPGSKDAIINKSAQIIKSISVKHYMPVDICSEFVALAEKQISFMFPYIPASGRCANFFELDHLTSVKGPIFMNFLGGSISNIPAVVKNGFPRLALMARLKKLTQFLPKGSLFLISQDACQDENKIVKSYNGKEKANFSKNVLYRIKRDLGITGFDPSLFDYAPIWHSEKNLLAHTLISTDDQIFAFEGQNIYLKKGQKFVVSNSYKYPENEFLSVLNDIGLTHRESFKVNDNGVVIHLVSI